MSFDCANPKFELNGMSAQVILASQGPDQRPIYTLQIRCPRIIWPEFLTHKMICKNARSSRAVPFKKLLAELRSEQGFTPWHWTGNQPGMQGKGGHDVPVKDLPWEGGDYPQPPEEAWTYIMDLMAYSAEAFHNAGYHKQIVNRLIEPFVFIDAVVTATDWENFFWLRDHEHAEPHLQDLAKLIKQAMDDAWIDLLQPGDWHLPYISVEDLEYAQAEFGNTTLGFQTKTEKAFLRQLSAARCARVSYAPFDGDASYDRELERFNSLVQSDRVHASPLEHQATPDLVFDLQVPDHLHDSIAGTAGRGLQHPYVGHVQVWAHAHQHGPLTGWIQHRKLIPNESVPG